jgi:hypothetical protein
MIGPLAPSDKVEGYCVLDIENDEDGKVISIAMAWRDKRGKIQTFIWWSWGEWWAWIIRMARSDKLFRTIWAHNGGGWDWLSLVEWLLADGRECYHHLSAAESGSKIVTLTVEIEKRFSIRLCDSYRVLSSSLDSLSKTFLGTHKVDLGGKLPHEILQENRELFLEYAFVDVINLLQILEKATELIRQHIAQVSRLNVTVASTAMKCFRVGFLQVSMSIPADAKVKCFLRSGYTGGRVEVFRYGKSEGVTVYDINSLYPSVMQRIRVPYSYRGYWTKKIRPTSVGCFLVKFRQKRRDIPAVLMVKGKSVYEGVGVYYTPELQYLKAVDPQCRVEVVQGYTFFDCAVLFRSFVSKMYQLRMTDYHGPIGYLCKLLGNSLYGKWGQKSFTKSIVRFREKSEIREHIPIHGPSLLTPINPQKGIYSLLEEKTCEHEHVAIAGLITSAARVELHMGLCQVPLSSLCYCDTDSVHTTSKLPDEIVGSELGKFKVEFHGQGCYCGKKMYALRKENPAYIGGYETKIRAKGVSIINPNVKHGEKVKRKMGAALSWQDIIDISKGKIVPCEFITTTSAKEVFSGKPLRFGLPGRKPNRKRKIGKT